MFKYLLPISLVILLLRLAVRVWWEPNRFDHPPESPNPVPVTVPLPAVMPSSPLPSPDLPEPLRVNSDRLWQTLNTIVDLADRYSEAGREQTRTLLIHELEQLGWAVETQAFPDGVNIIAQKAWGGVAEASEKPLKRWIVGAHYDTVAGTPGADDNGTGVAVLLELAHLFARASLAPPEPVSLELIFFDLEEQGLLGSFAYTQQPEHLEQLQGAIILEMLGYRCHEPGCQQYPQGLLPEIPSDRGDFLGVVGDTEHPEMLTAFSTEAQSRFVPVDLPIFTLSVPLKGVFVPDVLRSDHAPFWLQNIGAVMVTDTAYLRNPHYHQKTDTVETLDRSFLTQGAQAIANAVTYNLLHPLP